MCVASERNGDPPGHFCLEYPDTLRSVHNLAVALERQGKCHEAEPLYRRAVEGARKLLGHDHPDTHEFEASYRRFLNTALNKRQ